MTACFSSKLKTFVTTQHASGQDTGFSSAQDQKIPVFPTSGKPEIRTATATKTSKILRQDKEASRSREPSNGKRKKNASSRDRQHHLQTDRVGVNHLCILVAVMKYMDDLQEKSVVEAQESNNAQVKLTPRVHYSCEVPEATGPPAVGHLLLEQREKRGHVHPRPHERQPGNTLCTVKRT